MAKRLLFVFITLTLIFTPTKMSANLLDDLKDILNGKNAGQVVTLALDNDDLGRMFASGIDKQYGISNDFQMQSRLGRISNAIIAKNHIKGHYDFAILNSNIFNACSMYGGHIRFFEGMMRDTTNSDNELAFVVAHEIAHNSLGHNSETVKNFKIAYLADLLNITNKLPDLLKAGVQAVLAKRSRKLETQADANALKMMAQAGYSMTGAIALCRRIEAEHKIEQQRSGNANNIAGLRFNMIFATHPEPIKRVTMAEDAYFQQKYGTTFKQVAGASTGTDDRSNPTTGNLPVIVAHPSIWKSPLRITDRVCGVGIFNPSPAIDEEKDVRFYLDINMKNFSQEKQLAAVTADNDSHNISGLETRKRFTFVEGDYADPTSLVQALRSARTYASKDGTEIQDMNFPIGQDYPRVRYPHFTFKLVLKGITLAAPEVILYRDGDQISTSEAISFSNGEARYSIDNNQASADRHWYVLRVKECVITSPITLRVTKDRRDTINPGGSSHWQKGIIHFHSYYSDGNASLKSIWETARKHDVGFMFMTDHSDCFGENVNHKTKVPPHLHKSSNPYKNLVTGCKYMSKAMIPGVEFTLTGGKNRHLLILNLLQDPPNGPLTEEEFFNGSYPSQVCILKGPFHLGDDFPNTQIVKDAKFNFGMKAATLRMWIKGSPFKDPIIWINRHEVGRVVTTDNKWHEFSFQVPAEWLNNGKNLYHMESFIPDRWHTFDDCEVKEIWIVKN